MSPQEDLQEALETGNFERAKAALDAGANVNEADSDGFGYVPLFWAAAREGDPDGAAARVKWLLAAGARVALEQREDGETSLHIAAEVGNAEALRLLLAADGKCALGKFDYISRTPLICAVHKGHIECLRLLIEAGSDVNAHDEARIGNPALSWAVEEHNEEMVKVLLAAGADPLVPGWMQLSALDRAKPWRDSQRHPELRHIWEMLDKTVQTRPRR